MDKKKYAYTHEVSIYDAKGDLTKKWFVYYIDPLPDTPKRVRIYGKINQQKDIEGRRKAAEKLRQDTLLKLNDVKTSLISDEIQALLLQRASTLRPRTKQCYTSKLKYFR